MAGILKLPLLAEESVVVEEFSRLETERSEQMSSPINMEDSASPKVSFRGPSAPAYLFGNRYDSQNLFGSQDLVIMPRLSKTAPTGLFGTDQTQFTQFNSKHFPSIAWPTRLQNARLTDLLKFVQNESNKYGRPFDETGFTSHTMHSVFEKEIDNIYKLIENAKSLTDSLLGDGKYSSAQSLSKEANESNKKRDLISQANDRLTALPTRDVSDMSKRQQKGRKSYRAISEELNRRIKITKADQVEWDALEAKILAYQKSDKRIFHQKNVNLKKEYMSFLQNYKPDQRSKHLQEHKTKMEEHRKQVLERKKKMEQESIHQKRQFIQKKLDAAALHVQAEKEGNKGLAIAQHNWFIIVIVASRISQIQKTVEESRKNHMKNLTQKHACIVIQRAFRDYRKRQLMEKMKMSFSKISGAFSRYLKRRRIKMKHISANEIRTFFKDVHDSSKLMKIVKKYRYSVVKCQTYCRNLLEIQSARMTVLLKFCDKMEPQWRSVMKRTVNILDDTEDKKKKSKTNKTKKDEAANANNGISQMVKYEVLSEDLLKRLKMYRAEYIEYYKNLEAYSANIKKRLFVTADKSNGEDGVPKKPFFKLLPTPQQMIALIDKAWVASQQKLK